MVTLEWNRLKNKFFLQVGKLYKCSKTLKAVVKRNISNTQMSPQIQGENKRELWRLCCLRKWTFPHEYYYMQEVIQIFDETLLAQICHYIGSSPLICGLNKKKIYFFVFIFHKNLMKILYFPKEIPKIVLWFLFLCSFPEV